MKKEKKKINLWNFKEFEEYFISEENEFKLSVYCSILLEDWPYREKDDQCWYNIVNKTEKVLRKYHSQYFDKGFQIKTFSVEDKIVISSFLDLLRYSLQSGSKSAKCNKVDVLLCYSLSFDRDVVFKAFGVLAVIEDLFYVLASCLRHIGIYLKLASTDINLHEFFPDVKTGTYRPILNMKVDGSIYEVFQEYSKDDNVEDVYISLIYEMYGTDEKFIEILRRNAVIILLKNVKDLERLPKIKDGEKLKTDMKLIRQISSKININESRRIFIEETRGTQVSNELENIFSTVGDEFIGLEKIMSDDFLGKYLNYIGDVDLEFIFTVERYLMLRFDNKMELVELIQSLDFDKDDGMFYYLLETSLRDPDQKNIYIFQLFSLVLEDDEASIKGSVIIDMMERYIHKDKTKVLRSFLENCYIFICYSERFEKEFITGDRISLLCDELVNEKDDMNPDKSASLLKMTDLIYRIGNDNVEPFEESRFCSICVDIIRKDVNEDLVTYCLDILIYFIRSNPSVINELRKYDFINLLSSRVDIDSVVGIHFLKLLRVLSNDASYENELLENRVFQKLIDAVRTSNSVRSLSDSHFFQEFDHLFINHPKYLLQYADYCVSHLQHLKSTYEGKLLTLDDYYSTEEFLSFIRHYNKTLPNEESSIMIQLLVDLYVSFCTLPVESDQHVLDVFHSFVGTLTLFDAKTLVIKNLLIKMKDVVGNIEISNDIEWKIKAEKLLSAIYWVSSYTYKIRKVDCRMFIEVFTYSFLLFNLSVDCQFEDFGILGDRFFDGYMVLCEKQFNAKYSLESTNSLLIYIFFMLMKYSFRKIDVIENENPHSFFEMFLNKIVEIKDKSMIEIKDKSTVEIKDESTVKIKDKSMIEIKDKSMIEIKDKSMIEILFDFIGYLTPLVECRMIDQICDWIKKNNMLVDVDETCKENILKVFSAKTAEIQETKNVNLVLEFLFHFKFTNDSQRYSALQILSSITKDIDENMKKIVPKVVTENYLPGCDLSFSFLLYDLDFVANNIKRRNFSVLKDSHCHEKGFEYVVFLLNYHYEETMFELLCNTLKGLTYKKVKACRDNVIDFVREMRIRGLFKERYDFESDDSYILPTKHSDNEGYLYIQEEINTSAFNYLLEECQSNEGPIPWDLFIQFSKYCEVRLGKYDLLIDRRVLELCLNKGDCTNNQVMLLILKIFESPQDIDKMKNFLVKKRKSNINIEKYEPFLLKISGDISSHKALEWDDKRQDIEFLYLSKLAERDLGCLFIITEIIYNYSRYASLIDYTSIMKLLDIYLNSDNNYLGNVKNGEGAMRLLYLLSVCFISENSDFFSSLTDVMKGLLEKNGSDGICRLIFIFCNIAVIPRTKDSVLEADEYYPPFELIFKRFCSENILDSYLNKIDSGDLPDWNSSFTLIYDMGIIEFNRFLYGSISYYLEDKNLPSDNLDIMYSHIMTKDSLLGIAFNTVYNILYLTYEGDYEDTGIFNNKICFDEIKKNSIYLQEDLSSSDSEDELNSNDLRRRYENTHIMNQPRGNPLFKDRPVIHSIYKRLEIEFKDGDLLSEIMKETFELLGQVSLYGDDDEGSSGLDDEGSSGMDDEGSSGMESDVRNIPDVREESNIEVNVREETINCLIDRLFERKHPQKFNIVNVLKMFSLFDNTRHVVIRRSLGHLLKGISDNESFENIELALELIRLMTCDYKMKDVCTNSKIILIRCLFYLFRFRETAIKALYVLDNLDYDTKIFDPSIEFDIGEFCSPANVNKNVYFIQPSVTLKSEIISDIFKLNEFLITEDEKRLLRNIFDKILNGSLDTFTNFSIDRLRSQIINIKRSKESAVIFAHIEKDKTITRTISLIDLCFSSFFKYYGDLFKDEIKKYLKSSRSLEKTDFIWIYNKRNEFPPMRDINDPVYESIISRSMISSLHDLLTELIEPAIQDSSKVHLAESTGIYSIYLKLFSIYEGLMNYLVYCWPKMISDLEKEGMCLIYLNLRNKFSMSVVENREQINRFCLDQRDFDVDFLLRFNILDFTNKKTYFFDKLKSLNFRDEHEMVVERDRLLEDSFSQVMAISPEKFKSMKFQVNFDDEEGEDYGGLTREWLRLVVEEIVNPDLGLFVPISDDKRTILPSKSSLEKSNRLLYFRLVGRVIAKAILTRSPVRFDIDRTFYKFVLGKKCDLSDLEAIDVQFYNSLVWIKNNNIENLINLTFSTEEHEDLKPNGREISLTDENKLEYIDLVVEHKLFKGIEDQLEAMKDGLLEIIDFDLLSIFHENELELLVGGVPLIDVDDWKKNTIYQEYTEDSQMIKWFWKAVTSFTPDERAKLLQFSTGSSRVPSGGFSHLHGNNSVLNFSIQRSFYGDGRLPSAHTCFNQLDLPEYSSYVELRKSLLYAINECSEGFGFA